jgi:predicted alpha/beta hydrolase family esterase
MTNETHAVKPPDFSGWTTSRLQFLLRDYETNLGSVRTLFGRAHPDTRTYEQWIEAMREELGKRV